MSAPKSLNRPTPRPAARRDQPKVEDYPDLPEEVGEELRARFAKDFEGAIVVYEAEW